MDDGCSSDLELDITYEPEELEVLERNFPSPPSSGFGNKRTQNQLSPPTTKRSRRSVQKRVVSIPISEVEASRAKGGAAEGAPPSDSWAWRKYGQKPIKGSPYPRGYYRCSSSKGCPARKQVERSRADPTMIVVTYSFEHNHSWPMPKNKSQQIVANSAPTRPEPAEEEAPEAVVSVTEQETESSPPEKEQKFSDLIGEDCGEFKWLTEGCSTSSGSPPGAFDEMLYGSMFLGGGGVDDVVADVAEIDGGAGGEEDGLFEGLGELPEWTVVFRRGMTSASWIGTE